jgi:hypothetical protein
MVLSSLAHSAKNAQSTHPRAFVNPLDADLELSYALRGCTSLGSHLLGVVIATTPASTSPASWTNLRTATGLGGNNALRLPTQNQRKLICGQKVAVRCD